MTDEKKTEQWLDAFYSGFLTPENEEALLELLNREGAGEKWHTDRDLMNALRDPSRIPLPEGISGRLESAIDRHIAAASPKPFPKIKISLLSAAAVALLCIGLFFFTHTAPGPPLIADTYTNPKEAALAAEQALLLVSSKLNQGLSPLEKVKESINKTSDLINENLKIK